MDTIFSRYRNLTILAAVLFAQVLILAIQVKRPTEAGPVRLARYWVVALITPLEKAVVHTEQGISNAWHDYVWLRAVRRENDSLRDENERLRLEEIRLAQDAAQARRLQALLQFKEQTVSETVAAQVIGSSGSETSRIVYLDKGSNDGVRADMAVITPEGVVGKVLKAFPSSSQVLLLTDPSSGVGAILNNSRLQGILKGTPAGELILHYVMSDEKVQVGERLLTSGGDRIFPKGMPLGTVTQVSPGPDLFLNIRVKPAAQISRLEEVLVITKVVESAPAVDASASGPIRAADVLAQRLPTIVAQPPDAEGEKKHTDPPSFTEWLRQQKQAQAAAKQGASGGAPPQQQFAVPKPGTGTPARAKPATGNSTTSPSSRSGSAAATSPGASGTTGAAAAPKRPANAGEALAPQKKQPPAATATPGTAAPAPQTSAPRKQPAQQAPAPPKAAPQKPVSPPDQSPATPPGVTL